MRLGLALLATALHGAWSWTCAQPMAVRTGPQRAAITMGSFDDMMAKTAKRDKERATPMKRAEPAAAPQEESTSCAATHACSMDGPTP